MMVEFFVAAYTFKRKISQSLLLVLFVFYFFRYFNSGIKLLEGMRSYFEGLADELQKVRKILERF